MATPLNICTVIEQRWFVWFLWAKMWQQRMSTKKCCPCTVNTACHFKQPSKTTSFRGSLSWRWSSWKSSVRVVPTATTRILRLRFPGTCETVGQVFKFVWRLRWKINVVCMSLSPFFSFQSRFVTYLLTSSRISILPAFWCSNINLHLVISWFWETFLTVKSLIEEVAIIGTYEDNRWRRLEHSREL